MRKIQKKSVSHRHFIAMVFVSFCALGFSSLGSASNTESESLSEYGQATSLESKTSLKLMLNPESIESKAATLSRDEMRSIFRNRSSELLEPMLIIDWSDPSMFELPEKEFITPGV